MKLVIQRVESASVHQKETGKVVGKIARGLFILLGIATADTAEKATRLAEKVSNMRLMSDTQNKMNLSVLATKSEILVVSQFTLLANTSKGNRPSFINAAGPEKAKELYEKFIESLKSKGIVVESGSFGEYMEINAKLDGPVTIILDE